MWILERGELRSKSKCLARQGILGYFFKSAIPSSIKVKDRRGRRSLQGDFYILTKDGQCIFGNSENRSFRQQVELIDSQWNDLTDQQQTAVLEMYQLYESTMNRWNIPNILNAIG